MSRDLEKEILNFLADCKERNVLELKRGLNARIGFCSFQEVERALSVLKDKGLVYVSGKKGEIAYYKHGKEG